MAPEPPKVRIRNKSAPRGRSPNPKDLKKAKEAVTKGLVTPPPAGKKRRAESTGSGSSKEVARQLSFGKDSVHHIEAENKAGSSPYGDMKKEQVDKVWAALEKAPSNWVQTLQVLSKFFCFISTLNSGM